MKRREDTPTEKAIALIVEIVLAAIAIAVALLVDFAVGGVVLLTVVGPAVYEFFRKDDSSRSAPKIIISGDSSSKGREPKYDGELVSYQEYALPEETPAPENDDKNGFAKYASSSNEMEDIFAKKK